MTSKEVRETLEGHLGERDYTRFLRDFVKAARRKGRLMYWQEKALLAAGLRLSFEECVPVFTLCHIHRLPLSRRKIPVRRNVQDIRQSGAFEKAVGQSFPYALTELFGAVITDEVDHCAECVRQRQFYLART
jgi:hypothetical protein